MNSCNALRETLIEAGRGAPVTPELRAHVEMCSACARHLANERTLSAGLTMLATSQMSFPPAKLKNSLMAEFRRANRVTAIRLPMWQWTWAALLPVGALLVVAVVVIGHHPNKIAPKAASAAVVQPRRIAPVQAILPTPAAQPAPKPVKRIAKRRQARKVEPGPQPEPQQQPEYATDFFAIPYAEPLRPEERIDIYRVQMPRANMAVFGLPVAGGRLDSRVTADVMMGEDGVVRAIRLIR